MIETKIRDAEIKSRIREIIKSKGGNASELARTMNLSPTYFSTVINQNDKGVSATIFKKLAEIGIDLNWLLTGKSNAESEKLEIAESKIEELEKRLELIEYHSKELKQMILTQNYQLLNGENK